MTLDVAIVGAGPYGLSLAAHLRTRRVRFRIFGHPMRSWTAHMPPGMSLQSDGVSSSLSDPAASLTIRRFHEERGLPFKVAAPIASETFVAYGRAFQDRFVPGLEQRDVQAFRREGDGYRLTLLDGEIVRAANVVVAVGMHRFRHVPPLLRELPARYVSHSADYGPVDALVGREVVVIGSGASAIDLAAALHKHGSNVSIVMRRNEIAFQDPPGRPPRLPNFRNPGSGWTCKFCADAPHLFHMLPERTRRNIVASYPGVPPGWFMRDVIDDVPIISQHTPLRAEVRDNRVQLQLVSPEGTVTYMWPDHVVAATGYKVDVARLDFIDPALVEQLRTVDSAPVLSPDFESSSRGLYFIGPVAAMSFGPVMRSVYGATFTVRRLSEHLARSSAARVAPLPLRAGQISTRIFSSPVR